MIPTSGTTGRSKLVMQTHLAYVMAGEGFPFWMQLTSDDRLMTSLPLFHINAPAYSTLGSIAGAREPRAAARLLGEHVPRRRAPRSARPSSTASARCSRSSMRQPRAARRRRQPDPPLLHRPVARPRAPARDRGALRVRDRVRLRAVGVAVRARSGATASGPYGTLGSRAPASGARSRQRRACRRRRPGRRRGRDRRARAAQPGDHARLLRDARGDRGGDRRRLAAHRRPRARQRRRDVHVRRPQEGGDPPARREPVAGRGRGRARASSRRRRGGGDRRAVGPVGGRREGVRRRRARPRRPTSPRCTRSRASTSPRSRCRATSRWSTSCRTPPPTGWPSTSSRPTARRPRSTSTPARAVSP